jgi:Fe-S cluster biogenesis protein NfuA
VEEVKTEMTQKTVAAIAGACAGAAAKQWALRQGIERWLASLVAWLVGSTVTAAIARA